MLDYIAAITTRSPMFVYNRAARSVGCAWLVVERVYSSSSSRPACFLNKPVSTFDRKNWNLTKTWIEQNKTYSTDTQPSLPHSRAPSPPPALTLSHLG